MIVSMCVYIAEKIEMPVFVLLLLVDIESAQNVVAPCITCMALWDSRVGNYRQK